GGQRSAITGAVAAEALAYGDLSTAMYALAPRLVAYPIMEMGSDEQRARYLPAFAAAQFNPGAAALMEPRWDFDVLSMGTSAVRKGSGYLLNGDKCYVPLAPESELVLVYASTGSGAVDVFLVPRGCAGMTILEREKNMGIKALPTYGVAFSDCALADGARLGGE